MKTLEQLEKESDSTEFWEILRSANDSVKNAEIPPISEEKWLKHFQTLHTDINMEHKQFDINEKLQNLEKQSDCFNEPDFPITDREILSCAKALETKKACGIDKISNEMIKSSIFLICSVLLLTKLFNVILMSGFFPESWSMSIITPVFKSGSRSNPENHRGICVSSCL